MRHLNSRQRRMVFELSRSLEDASNAWTKRASQLAQHGAMPRFVRVLIATAQSALADAAAGIVDWADGSVDDDGVDRDECSDVIDLELANTGARDEDFGN